MTDKDPEPGNNQKETLLLSKVAFSLIALTIIFIISVKAFNFYPQKQIYKWIFLFPVISFVLSIFALFPKNSKRSLPIITIIVVLMFETPVFWNQISEINLFRQNRFKHSANQNKEKMNSQFKDIVNNDADNTANDRISDSSKNMPTLWGRLRTKGITYQGCSTNPPPSFFIKTITGPIKNRFVDNKDGSITDLATGLMWTKGAVDRGCSFCTVGGYKKISGGKPNPGRWRFPTTEELISLAEYQRSSNDLFIDPIFDPIKYSMSDDDAKGFPFDDRDWPRFWEVFVGYNQPAGKIYCSCTANYKDEDWYRNIKSRCVRTLKNGP